MLTERHGGCCSKGHAHSHRCSSGSSRIRCRGIPDLPADSIADAVLIYLGEEDLDAILIEEVDAKPQPRADAMKAAVNEDLDNDQTADGENWVEALTEKSVELGPEPGRPLDFATDQDSAGVRGH